MADIIAAYESLSVIEDFFGEELSQDLITRFTAMPHYQLRELCSRLDNSFKHGIPRRRTTASLGLHPDIQIPSFQPVFSHDVNLKTWELTLEHWIKSALLYFPGSIAIPDPIGAVDDIEYLEEAVQPGGDYLLTRLKLSIVKGLRISLAIRPLLLSGTIITIPWPSIMQVFRDAHALMYGAPLRELPSYGTGFSSKDLRELFELNEGYFLYNDRDELIDFDVYGMVAFEWLVTGALIGVSPVAADSRALAAMKADVSPGPQTPEIDMRVAQVISRFRIPGADQASLREVVSLRLNDDAFQNFRLAFRSILVAVSSANPQSETAFSSEFRRYAFEALTEQRAHLRRRRDSSDALQQILTGFFLLGAASIESAITKEVPVGSLLATGAVTNGWLAAYLGRHIAVKKADMLTRTFFGYLMPTE